jgi:hypothetical protein
MSIQSAVDTINTLEVVLWITLGIVCWLRAKPRTITTHGWSLALILFGLSDIVELQTGAFWRPWWLFVWKSGCVAMFMALFVGARRPK